MNCEIFDLTSKLDYKPRLITRIKWWFRRRKLIKERAKRGWSSYDVWDFDSYLAYVIGEGLEFLSENHMSHPWDVTPEEWSERLKYIANCFKQYNEKKDCPSYEAYCAEVKRIRNEDGSISTEAPMELLQAWREEEKRNYNEKMNRLKEGFDLLFEIYPNLWD